MARSDRIHCSDARCPLRRIALLAIALAVLVLLLPGQRLRSVSGQDPADDKQKEPGDNQLQGQPIQEQLPQEKLPQGHIIRVPLPITGNIDKLIQRQVNLLETALTDQPADGKPPVLVFEFKPRGNQTGAGSEFGRSYELAQFLISEKVQAFRTIAFIPGVVEGHALLAVMACQEIVMGRGAELGVAGGSGETLNEVARSAYLEIATRRQNLPAEIALSLLDPRVQVHRVRTADGTRYTLELAKLQENKEVVITEIDQIVRAGEIGHFTSETLHEDGFVSYLADHRQELVDALQLSSLRLDPSLGGQWRAIRIDISGAIDTREVNRVLRGIEDKIRTESINFVCLNIDSFGGSTAESQRLASYLAELENHDKGPIHTVAYISKQATADASLLALACDVIVLHEEATLGGDGENSWEEPELSDLRSQIRELAKVKSRRWSLWAAMVDKNLLVHRYTRQGTGQTAYFSQEELADEPEPDLWKQGDQVTPDGSALQVDSQQALDLRLANYVVADFNELTRLYGLEKELEVLKPNWALELIEALASERIAWFLLFVGGFALYSESMAPGIGIGGFIACVCFLLFFWSQFLHGTAGWLEVLLFILGIVSVAMEIFVLPGFGIFGLGGALLIMVSLVLAQQTFIIPQSTADLEKFPQSLLSVVAAGVGIFVAIVFMSRYLHKTPGLSRAILMPPTGSRLEELQRSEAMVDFEHLIGQHGTALTPLMPAGKARIADEVVDVISDGEPVPQAANVRVIDVRGNVVVVQRVDHSDLSV